MNTKIVVVFITLAVAIASAGVISGAHIAAPLAAPLVASPLSAGLVSSPVIAARSVVASPLSAGIIAAPGIAAPLPISRSIIATPHASIVSAPAISPLAVAPVAAW